MLKKYFASTASIAAVSVLVGVVVLALKYYAFILTGSVALYSDALITIHVEPEDKAKMQGVVVL